MTPPNRPEQQSPSELATRQAEAAIGQAIISLREHGLYWPEIGSIVTSTINSIARSEQAKKSLNEMEGRRL
jgi:hypothetical protein